MEQNEQTIDSILKERRDYLRKKLQKNPIYIDLQKVENLIEYIESSNSGVVSESQETYAAPIPKKEVEKPKQNISPQINGESGQTYFFRDEKAHPKFPLTGKRVRGRQLEYIVREYGKAITKKQIQTIIKEKAGITSNIREALKRSVSLGDLVYVKFNSSLRYAFVALPEWIEKNSSGKHALKQEYWPELKDLPEKMDNTKQEVTGYRGEKIY